MAGMPAMQEQLPAMARDGRYAGNAGAIAGDGQESHGIHAMRIHSLNGRHVCLQRRSSCRRWPGMAGMPAMQEQLPAMALDGWLPSTQEPLQAAFRLANRPVPKVILVEYGSRCYADA
jgi:hypothetical protein